MSARDARWESEAREAAESAGVLARQVQRALRAARCDPQLVACVAGQAIDRAAGPVVTITLDARLAGVLAARLGWDGSPL